MKEKELTPFTVLYDLSKGKLYNKEDIETSGLSIFLLLNFIKTSSVLIPIASYLNQNSKMNFYNMYLFVFFSFRLYNVRYCKWNKALKVPKQDDVENIMNYFKVKKTVAIEYLESMNKKQLDYIKLVYRD